MSGNDQLTMCRIFARCTSFAAAELLSGRTTSRELLTASAELLLEGSSCAVVPLNLLAMLMCCPAAVQVLVGKPKSHQPPHGQRVGLDCNASGLCQSRAQTCDEQVVPSQQCSTSSATAADTGVDKFEIEPEHQRPEHNGRCVHDSSMNGAQSHPHNEAYDRKGHPREFDDAAKRPITCSVPGRQGEAGTGDPVSPSSHSCTEHDPHVDQGVEELGHALCGMFRALRSNLLQPVARPLLDVLGAIAREPGGGSWLQRCGISLRVVGETLFQSNRITGHQAQEAENSGIRGKLAEVQAPRHLHLDDCALHCQLASCCPADCLNAILQFCRTSAYDNMLCQIWLLLTTGRRINMDVNSQVVHCADFSGTVGGRFWHPPGVST